MSKKKEEQLAQAQSVFPAAECGFDGKRTQPGHTSRFEKK